MASKLMNEAQHVLRFSDLPAQSHRMLPPIQGYEQMPLVTLQEAVNPLLTVIPDVERMVWTVKQRQLTEEHHLSMDESASILLYSMEWEPRDKSFYIILNQTLQAANRDLLKPWFLYLRLVMTALDKLPFDSHQLTVYRGVNRDLRDQYPRGSIITWWGFSSCTTSLEVLNNERFLGRTGTRTLFNIECHSAKNIKTFSFYPEEEEALLPPGRQFQVLGCLDQGHGLHIIQMKEIQPKYPLINPVPQPSSMTSSLPNTKSITTFSTLPPSSKKESMIKFFQSLLPKIEPITKPVTPPDQDQRTLNALTMTNTYIDPQSTIIWVDSSPNIYYSTNLLQAQNWRVACFNETADALKALRKRRLEPSNIHCVITSMMERGGRRERGCLNGLEMLDEIKIIWREAGIHHKPFIAVISLTADIQKCKAYGADIVVFGNHNKLQHQIIDHLNKRLSSTHNGRVVLIGIAGPSGCGKTTYAKHLAQYLRSPFLPISLDAFFTSPITVDHPSLGRIPSLEQPESININGFFTLLSNIKSQVESVPVQRSSTVIERNKPIYVVAEGFLLFALSDGVTSMFDIRIFLNSTQVRCRMQRFRRDAQVNPKLSDSDVIITDKYSQWYDDLVWAEYLKRRDLQMAKADKVFEPEEYQKREYTSIDAYISTRLTELV